MFAYFTHIMGVSSLEYMLRGNFWQITWQFLGKNGICLGACRGLATLDRRVNNGYYPCHPGQ